jgi:hypothetical protein
MPQDEWRVVIPDHHSGYITWDQFLANRHHLAANRTNCEVLAGPAREGLCLLQGVLICGICGRRLSVRYTGNRGLYPIYQCKHSGGRCSAVEVCRVLAKDPLDIRRVQSLQNIANRCVGAWPLPANLESFVRPFELNLDKRPNARYELAPVTLAKMENSKIYGN